MRYRATGNVRRADPGTGGVPWNAREHDTHCGTKSTCNEIERPGWHPTARNDLNQTYRQSTALRSLARWGHTS